MQITQSQLVNVLCSKDLGAVESYIKSLSCESLAEVYFSVCLFKNAVEYLTEETWITRLTPEDDLVARNFKNRFKVIGFLVAAVEIKDIKKNGKFLDNFEAKLIAYVKQLTINDQKLFVLKALMQMRDLFFDEDQILHGEVLEANKSYGLNPSFYRTYDRLDEVFELDYSLDATASAGIVTEERIYEGAGVGVQSSYWTILTVLRELNVEDEKFVDLGSGYGRLGLILGILLPQVDFIGYEYLDHRVKMSNAIAKKFNLEERIRFITQDLSAPDFKMPEADIYYMYDPFCRDTYIKMLNSLLDISANRQITIVTKGNASQWLKPFADTNGWREVLNTDGGNICAFRSRNL